MSTFQPQDFIDFVVREARLIDEQRFDDWLAMFTEDGHYWMPLEYRQTDPLLQPSFLYEDKLLLKIRVERLSGARTFSQRPKSRCHHLLQTPTIDKFDLEANEVLVHTPMHYIETRLDEQNIYGVWADHTLCVEEGEIRIKLKRVELVNSDSHFGNIQLFM